MRQIDNVMRCSVGLYLRQFCKYAFTPLLLLQGYNLVAQTGIAEAYTTVVTNPSGHTYTGGSAPGAANTVGTNNKTYFYGSLSGNSVPMARQIQSFQTLNSTFTYNIGPVVNVNVFLRRQASPANGVYNVDLLYFEGTINGATTELRTNYPYLPKMEDNFSHRFIGMGTDNLFTNTTNSVNHNAIERVDVIVSGGYTIENAGASGLALFERGAANAHDACVVGIVTAVDINGTPTAYAQTFILVNSSNYNTVRNLYGGDTADYFVARRNVNTNDNLLVSNVTMDQGVGGVYLNLSEFGLTNNQVIYGYSFFAPDFWTATTPANRAANALNWNNTTYFPTNTSETTGGIDLSMIAGIVKKMKIQGLVYHDQDGLENQAVDGILISQPESQQLYVYLVNPALSVNNIIAKVPVANDGSFVIDKTVFGTLNLVLSSDGSGTEGGTWNSNLQKLPAGWSFTGEAFGTNNAAGTGINDGTGTGNNAPATAKDGIVAISFTSEDITNVRFGIQQPPTAQEKDYLVDASAFHSGTPGASFPALSAYKYIRMNAALTDINNGSNGSLAGTDPEDCATGNCNGNTGGVSSTFVIGSINANTRLFYDFGTGNGGVQEIVANTATATIPGFDINKMVIYASSGAGSAGNEVGFTYAIKDKAASQSPFVTYKIATTQPLPVRLINFEVSLNKAQAELRWTTAKEESNKEFKIERSTDGNNWRIIGAQASDSKEGAAEPAIDYYFVDVRPLAGPNYYRLKQIDIDGTFAYSPVRSVWLGQDNGIKLFPNPLKDHLLISGLSGKERILIYDLTGRLVYRAVAGNSEVRLSLAGYGEGVYHLQIIKPDSDVLSHKILIMK